MYELELKAKADHDNVRALLHDLSAEYYGNDKIVDVYYDTPNLFLEGRGETLRLRSCNDGHTICFKGRDGGRLEKSRQEFESEINLTTGHAILTSLGYIKVGTIVKDREIFIFDNMTICLDSVEGIGDFVEIEIVQHFESEKAKKRIFEFAEALGLTNFIKDPYIRMHQIAISRRK